MDGRQERQLLSLEMRGVSLRCLLLLLVPPAAVGYAPSGRLRKRFFLRSSPPKSLVDLWQNATNCNTPLSFSR
jgi:hypothetical protein